MRVEVIGVGGAGCRLADAIRAAEPADHAVLTDVFVFDTDEGDLERAVVPASHRYRYGPADGPGDDVERGFEVGAAHADELLDVLDRGRRDAADAVLVAVGLGGATGGGTAPALVAALQRAFDGPVYVLATLPADREFAPDEAGPQRGAAAGGRRPPRPLAAANAVRALDRLDGLANAVVCFDDEEWLRRGESVAEARDRLNREFARRVVALLSAGSETTAEATESAVDADGVAQVLGNRSEVATIGYGAQEVDAGGSRFGLGLFSSSADVETREAVSAVETAVGKALHGKLTLECERETAERAMLIVGGPPSWLDRRAVADGQRKLESAIGSRSIVGGDAPRPDGDTVFSVVVLAGVDPERRVGELREAASERAHTDG